MNSVSLLQGRAAVAYLAHNQEVGGANPPPATTNSSRERAVWYGSQGPQHLLRNGYGVNAAAAGAKPAARHGRRGGRTRDRASFRRRAPP